MYNETGRHFSQITSLKATEESIVAIGETFVLHSEFASFAR